MERMDISYESSMHLPEKFPPGSLTVTSNNTIQGHRHIQSKHAVWLGIENIYEKLYTPNTYDLGGSYTENVPDYWFTFKTSRRAEIFLLHLFAVNHTEGTYSIGVSSDPVIFNVKDQVVLLDEDIDVYELSSKKLSQSYIKTFTFKEMDVELLFKNKKLCILVELNVNKNIRNQCLADKLLRDYRVLVSEPDFIIESADGIEFPVHRNLLCFSSDVFKAMLNEDMAESKNGRVKYVDIESGDMKIVLEYIYTGTIKDVENVNLPNLLMLADRFNIITLRKLCDYLLVDQLSPATALDILILADRYASGKVKKMALHYIKWHKKLMKDELNLDLIDNKKLMKELVAALIS